MNNEKTEIVKEFSIEETEKIEKKITDSIIKADKNSRINEALAIENASKAFLTSQKVSSTAVIKSFDWAVEQKNKGVCIISGFQSIIEKDVFDILLKGTQPVILVLARGLKKYYDEKMDRVTKEIASKRNLFMTELANEICIGYASVEGSIDDLSGELLAQGKKVLFLDEDNKNRKLFYP